MEYVEHPLFFYSLMATITQLDFRLDFLVWLLKMEAKKLTLTETRQDIMGLSMYPPFDTAENKLNNSKGLTVSSTYMYIEQNSNWIILQFRVVWLLLEWHTEFRLLENFRQPVCGQQRK